MGRKLQKGWRVYDRDGIWWITYPLDGDTKRESARTRDLVMAEVFLAERRREIEGAGPANDFDGQPKDYADDGTVRPLCGPNVDPAETNEAPVRLPEPLVSLAQSLLDRARRYEIKSTLRYAIRLAAAIKRHHRGLPALRPLPGERG